jgi:hypothetical protein
MSPRNIWPVLVLLLMTGGATTAQEKEDDPHSRVQVKFEVLNLYDGLPGGGWSGGLFSVGGHLGKQTSMRKDSSGKVVYRRTIEGQSRWLPDNAIEITLEITENDVKRTERILLEGFEPKTLVLREDPAHGRRELLRLIPVSGPVDPDKSLSVPVEGLGKMGSNPREPLDLEPGKLRLLSPVLIRDNQVLINMADSMGTATGDDAAAMLYSPGQGRFIFSSVPFEGAIEGKRRFNQISFTLEGKSYLLLTGAPISSSPGVWMVHQPFWRPSGSELGVLGDQPMVSTSSLRVLLDPR